MEHISIDSIIKPLKTPSGYNTIWVIIDRLSKSSHFFSIDETDMIKGVDSHLP